MITGPHPSWGAGLFVFSEPVPTIVHDGRDTESREQGAVDSAFPASEPDEVRTDQEHVDQSDGLVFMLWRAVQHPRAGCRFRHLRWRQQSARVRQRHAPAARCQPDWADPWR